MKKYYGSRSKISLLPHQVRWRIYNLMLDGATLKSLLADPEIDAALALAGFTLNDHNLSFARKSREFTDFVQMRRKYLERKYKDMMSAAIAKGAGALESMTEQTRCKLMENLSELADLSGLPDEERIKAVRSLTQSVASLSNPVKDSQIAELKRKLIELEKENEALQAEIANLKAATDQDPAGRGLSENAIRQAEEKIKLL
jgi:predicted RNase H-like nuclease (RuvC/YqgF family)